jgi:2-keto-4-pentenoate hydratase
MSETIAEAAARLAGEHRTRAHFTPLPADRLGDLEFAYAVQDALVGARLAERQDRIAGWKIGLTTARMQQMCGIDQPIAGAILASTVHASPGQVRASDHVRLGVEMELAVRLGEPLPATETVAPGDVWRALDGVCAAFELVEDRAADYAALDAASLIADNSWNAGIVLGEPISPAALGHLLGREGVLTRDGAVAGRGMTEDAGGDPLKVVAWVDAMLRRRGRALAPGQWVMTGSIVPTLVPKAGEHYRFAIDGLPAVEVAIV